MWNLFTFVSLQKYMQSDISEVTSLPKKCPSHSPLKLQSIASATFKLYTYGLLWITVVSASRQIAVTKFHIKNWNPFLKIAYLRLPKSSIPLALPKPFHPLSPDLSMYPMLTNLDSLSKLNRKWWKWFEWFLTSF